MKGRSKQINLSVMAMTSALLRRLEGKVALITGASSGIGKSSAELFSRHGAKIVVADIRHDEGNKLCIDLGSSSSATFVHCDVTKESDVKNAVNATVEKYGKLDIMFNNAGICDAIKPNILDNDVATFEQVLRVNLVGAFLGAKHVARAMVPNRAGVIISTASIASVLGGCAPHAYTSSKHGLLGLTRNLAVELGQHGIRVNCISPDTVPTPMVKRVLGDMDEDGCKRRCYSNLKGVDLETRDVAEAALYLASDEAKCVSGHNLSVDGGLTIVNAGFSLWGVK